MGLYSADLESVAQPVKKGKGKKKEEPVLETETPKPEKKKRVKKVKIEEPAVLADVANVEKKKSAKVLAKEKKIAEEKKQTEEKNAMEAEKLKALAEKKALAAEKRRKRKAEKETDKAVDEAIKEAIEEPKAKKAKSDDPPKWFKKYIEGVAVEQNSLLKEKKPRIEVKKHADEVAERSWRDGFTRDRVQTEVDAHMDRMYQMMFSRKLK